MQAVADLRRAQLAQITVQILNQMRHVGACHLGQHGGQFIVMMFVVVVLMRVRGFYRLL